MDAVILGAFGINPTDLSDDEWVSMYRKASWWIKVSNPFPTKKK